MKIVFMGTPVFAIPVLSALLQAKHDIVAVYTRSDKPAGRGKPNSSPPVKLFAEKLHIPFIRQGSLSREVVRSELAKLCPDVIVVAAYGLLLPQSVISLASRGCLNIHPSLLPKYRGPSPVATAILEGEEETGVTIMELDDGMDTGSIVTNVKVKILEGENAEELTSRLFRLGADLLVQILPDWVAGDIDSIPQDGSQATVTALISREDGEIDWSTGAGSISRKIRAYQPWPGAYTIWNGRRLKMTEAELIHTQLDGKGDFGRVLSLTRDRIAIWTGNGMLEINRLQLEGRGILDAGQFRRGYPEFIGSKLGP